VDAQAPSRPALAEAGDQPVLEVGGGRDVGEEVAQALVGLALNGFVFAK
jgi:hypothetical protein